MDDNFNPLTERSLSDAARILRYRSVCTLRNMFLAGDIPGARKVGRTVAIPLLWIMNRKAHEDMTPKTGVNLQRGRSKTEVKKNKELKG